MSGMDNVMTYMQLPKVVHVCTGCGKREKRNPNKRQWCKCNPDAPFKMMIEKDYQTAHYLANDGILSARKAIRS